MRDVPEDIRVIPDDLVTAVEWAKRMKTTKVEGTKAGENDDVAPVLSVERNGRHVALVFCKDVNRDEALQAACVAVPLFAADTLDMILDVHVADQEFIERYGRTPDPLELQNLCDNEGACEIGLISDGISLMHVERDPDGDHKIAQVLLPYHVHKTARECHWIDDKISVLDLRHPIEGQELKVKGIVIDGLMQAFNNLVPAQTMAAEGIDPKEMFGLEPDEAEIHTDCVAVGLLGRFGFAVAYAPENDKAAAIFEDSMSRSGTLAYSKGGIDGPLVEPKPGNYSSLDLLGELAAEKLRLNREASHAADVAEAERRRAERAAGNFTPETMEDITRRYRTPMDTEAATSGNREQRRAAARAKRK